MAGRKAASKPGEVSSTGAEDRVKSARQAAQDLQDAMDRAVYERVHGQDGKPRPIR